MLIFKRNWLNAVLVLGLLMISSICSSTCASAATTAIKVTSSAASPNAGTSNTFTAPQVAEIERIVHSYLVKNPQVIVEVARALQSQASTEMEQRVQAIKDAAAKHKHEIFNVQSAGSAALGSTAPKVIMAEYYSYQCPICREVSAILAKLIKANSDLQIVFIPWPFKGNDDVYAAKMALAAKKQGKFYDVHAAFMQVPDALTQTTVDQMVAKLGLDMVKLKSDMNDKAIEDALRASFKLAHDLNLIGTPMIFISNAQFSKFELIPGRADEASIQQAINGVR